MYINPLLYIHSTFAEAKEFYDNDGALVFWARKDAVGVDDVAKGTRNLVVGEPGVGKTELLKEVRKRLEQEKITAGLIALKDQTALDKIDKWLAEHSTGNRALLLDGLDEVQASLFPTVLEKIRETSASQPLVSIYLSSRWLFITRHAAALAAYRFVTVAPFTHTQVRKYLVEIGQPPAEVDGFLDRMIGFSHNVLVIQIPRYLFLLADFLKNHGIGSVVQLSRNGLFEHFIYSKLALEDTRLNAGKRALTKRFLEKLALVMEIYQANRISKDELMTFFDDVQSDLTLSTLAQLDLEVLVDKTLLKDDGEFIEFDNTEFQEYLAAKELARFVDPRRAAFGFAVDQQINQLHPSWFNTLSFLVDMHPELLEQIIEFSGLRGSKVIDEGFLKFLSRIDPKTIEGSLKGALFKDLIAYHSRTLQWFYGPLAPSMPGLFDASLEDLLKQEVASAHNEPDVRQFIRLGNVALVVGYLFESGAPIDSFYWRKHLLSCVSDNKNEVVRRRALFALGKSGDPSAIDDLPHASTNGERSIAKAFLSMCIALNPEHPVSLESILLNAKKGEMEARYGLYALRSKSALKHFLEAYSTDVNLRRGFLDKASIFNDQDCVLVDHISSICDTEIAVLAENAICRSFEFHTANEAGKAKFVLGLGKIVKNRDSEAIARIVRQLQATRGGLYFTQEFFASLLDTPEDVERFLPAMIAAGEPRVAFSAMLRIRAADRPDSETIFEAGRQYFAEYYDEFDSRDEAVERAAAIAVQQTQVLAEFRRLLEPEPGKYNTGVFAFYLQHADALDAGASSADKDRLAALVRNEVLQRIDPAAYGVQITDEQPTGAATYTFSSHISLFHEALQLADHLKIDVAAFRQQITNFIPFAYNDDLQLIFRIVGTVTPQEAAPLIDVYRQKQSDKWRHTPISFIEAAERYYLRDARPVLQAMVRESAILPYVRQRALEVADSLSPDKNFLQQILQEFSGSARPDENQIATTAESLLITKYADPECVRKRLGRVIAGAAPFSRPEGAHVIGPLEDEIIGRTFANPLLQVRTPGFEQDYLQLLDSSITLWAQGTLFHTYATYLWDIVYAYFNNLKDSGSYKPLRELERTVESLSNREGANWLAARMAQLRRAYLSVLGRPNNIAEAVQLYNDGRQYHPKKISSSRDLAHHLQEALETDLARWIEDEGAYDLLLTGKVSRGTKRQPYEKLVQKTLKSQIENILFRRGFEIDLMREPQLLDEKRTDILVRYGFVGPVVVEIKLTSNKDIRTTKPEESPSFVNLKTYMLGYGASHSILLIVDNEPYKHLATVAEAFQRLPNVWVKVFKCRQERKLGSPRKRKREAKDKKE